MSVYVGFFKAAARRSKRGCRGKLHRCNGGREQARVLSRDFHDLNYRDLGNTFTGGMDLKTAINYICDHKVPVNSNARGRFQINNNYWYDFDIIRSADDYYSGFISGHTVSEAYQFYRMRGADAVIKKLGSAPADALIKATNTTYKATEEEDVLVIWEHSGRCRTQKHPTPHSTFTIIAAGITKVTSVLKGNGGDYQYSAAGNYFVQHLSAGQTITCSLSEDDFSSRYRMYVIKATL